jgi:hypothetical protein
MCRTIVPGRTIDTQDTRPDCHNCQIHKMTRLGHSTIVPYHTDQDVTATSDEATLRTPSFSFFRDRFSPLSRRLIKIFSLCRKVVSTYHSTILSYLGILGPNKRRFAGCVAFSHHRAFPVLQRGSAKLPVAAAETDNSGAKRGVLCRWNISTT